MNNYFILLLLLVLFSSSLSHAQWIEDSIIEQRVQRGIDELYNYDFDKAESDISASSNYALSIRSDTFSGL